MTINLFQPALRDEELEAVREVFDSNWIGRGPRTREFEERFASYCGVARETMRSVSCCTEGLFQSMNLLGLGTGDEVVLPSISFVGAGNAVAASGARPVFCDVDPRTLNPRAEHIEAMLSERTRAVMVIHYGGLPCELDPILDLLRGRDIALIEDSACSIASSYRGRRCGTFGDIGVWSFDAMKILVCGDGGMVYCRSRDMAQVAEEELYLGMTSAAGFSSDADSRWWEFDVTRFGRRAIMNDVASAIGLQQLEKVPSFVARRRQVHELYDEALADLDWLCLPPAVPDHMESSYYMYWVQARPDLRDRLATHLRDQGIYTSFRYFPLHRIPIYGSSAQLPGTDEAADSTLCLPLHQSLSDADVERVAQAIRSML